MLTKPQVIAEFETKFLPHCKTLDDVKMCWKMNMEMLFDDKRITQYAFESWVFPKEIEEKFNQK